MVPKLRVVEAADAVFVCDGEDSDEWVVRFERRPGFDAEGWARRMVVGGARCLDRELRDA